MEKPFADMWISVDRGRARRPCVVYEGAETAQP
jgi:hypothetical protein